VPLASLLRSWSPTSEDAPRTTVVPRLPQSWWHSATSPPGLLEEAAPGMTVAPHLPPSRWHSSSLPPYRRASLRKTRHLGGPGHAFLLRRWATRTTDDVPPPTLSVDGAGF
jgi:hypothetical protein